MTFILVLKILATTLDFGLWYNRIMKKKGLIFYCITVMLFCQVFLVSPGKAISEAQKTAIVEGCSSMKEILSNIQKSDSRTRVYLGSYYERVLSRFITKLNLRLVENNMPKAELVDNQTDFAEARAKFSNDFVSYQRSLEELTVVDCTRMPERFYEDLKTVREKRAVVKSDTVELKRLILENRRLAKTLTLDYKMEEK